MTPVSHYIPQLIRAFLITTLKYVADTDSCDSEDDFLVHLPQYHAVPEHHDSSYAVPNSVLSGGMTHTGAATSVTDDINQQANDLGITVQEAQDLEEGDVKVLFHLASGKPYEIITADVYQRRAEIAKDFPWLDPEPWRR